MSIKRRIGFYLLGALAYLATAFPAFATNYITTTGVQNFSITIASGSTSGTATITGVGTGAFIIYAGESSPTSTSMAQAATRVELTNSTTVTANRNASPVTTVTVKGSVIDATSSLITSIQKGTITIASGATTGTASISAVTNANTAVHLLGFTGTDTGFTPSSDLPWLSLSGTTVTATIAASQAQTVTVGYEIIEFNGSALNSSVQQKNTAWTSTTTPHTVTITSVTTGNTMILSGGQGGNGANPARVEQKITLTNATTLTIDVGTAASLALQYNCSVIEFVPGVLNSSTQRGTITISGATSGTATITAVGAQAFANNLGMTATVTGGSLAAERSTVALTNTTTVTATKGSTTASGPVSYEAIDLAAFVAPGGTTDAIWFGEPF